MYILSNLVSRINRSFNFDNQLAIYNKYNVPYSLLLDNRRVNVVQMKFVVQVNWCGRVKLAEEIVAVAAGKRLILATTEKEKSGKCAVI